jgi:hypothetical protein
MKQTYKSVEFPWTRFPELGGWLMLYKQLHRKFILVQTISWIIFLSILFFFLRNIATKSEPFFSPAAAWIIFIVILVLMVWTFKLGLTLDKLYLILNDELNENQLSISDYEIREFLKRGHAYWIVCVPLFITTFICLYYIKYKVFHVM